MKDNKCPWCDFEQDELWEYDLDDGDDVDSECGSCGKGINIRLSISYDYKVSAIGCDNHTLEIGPYWHSGFTEFLHLKCTECKEEFYDWQLPGGRHPKLKEGQFSLIAEAQEALSKIKPKSEAQA